MTDVFGEIQYHCRYKPQNGDEGPYWTRVTTNRAFAVADLRELHADGYEAVLLERECRPWKIVEP
jgi:hypothetical protein